MNFFPDKQKYLTVVGPIEVVTPAQLAAMINIEQVHHTMPVEYPSMKKVEVLDQNWFDAEATTFEKKEVQCKAFSPHRAVQFIEQQILELNFEHASADLTLASNWDEVVERAAVSANENFGDPTHACVLPGNRLFLADLNGDAIRLLWGYNPDRDTVGALVAFHPMKQTVCKFGPAAAMGSFVAKMGLR